MTKIEELLAELCPNGVVWKELGEVCDTVVSPIKLKRNEYQSNGAIAIIDQGEEFIAGYIDIEKYLPKDEYVIFGDHSEHIKFVNFPFVQGADGLKILKSRQGVIPKYLYYCFCNFYKKEGNYKRHWSVARTTPIPIPPLEIQQEIVALLDTFTEYVTELTAELTDRQKQYSFYRDKLLSFEDEVYQVEWKTLGEVFDVIAGGDAPKEAFSEIQTEEFSIPILSNGIEQKAIYGWTNIAKIKEPSLTVSARGTIGWTSYQTKPFYPIVRLLVLTPKIKVNLRYAYYYLKSIENNYEIPQSGIPQLTRPMIKEKVIPIPSPHIQERIVQVLDNFDTVCNDLKIGLPKEIELRQKQYEYFREKLLTFTAEGVYPGQWTVDSERGLSDLIRLLQWVFGPIRVQLGAVASYSSKKVSTSILNVENYVGVDNLLQNKSGKVDATYLPTQQNVNEYQIEDILVGNIRPYLKKIWFATNNGGASPDVLVFQNQTESCLSNRFLFHVLASDNFFEYDMKNAKGSKMPRGDKNAILQFQFIMPKFSDQSRIVSILDAFDNLTSSITEGLPKEIELRQKQYEYFRDKLLKFR
jgi:type I restriction enzyme S subunit